LGWLGPILDPVHFVSAQIPSAPTHDLLPTEHILALQLGNCYGLACLVGVAVLFSTREVHTVRSYLIALLIADVGHVSVSMWALGREAAWDVANWNDLAWGNIGFTAFLGTMRVLTLAGAFGKFEAATEEKKRK
jgi:hypothetical protein